MNETQKVAHNARLNNRIAVLEDRIEKAMEAHKHVGILSSAMPMKVKKWKLAIFNARKELVV